MKEATRELNGAGPLRDLFVQEIRDLFAAEAQIMEAIPGWAMRASDPALGDALREHLLISRDHLGRLEVAANSLRLELDGTTCQGIAGILSESLETSRSAETGPARDAAILCGAKKVEHYEIAGYGSALEHARLLGEHAVVDLLAQTLEEEEHAARTLTGIEANFVDHSGA
jgi:ferritin-like metal-binding protein YciE